MTLWDLRQHIEQNIEMKDAYVFFILFLVSGAMFCHIMRPK